MPCLHWRSPTDRLPTPQDLAQCEAVTLFIQRAKAARPDFEVTPANASTIAELCARLDGLPLAIELAAARIKLLPLQALLARLSNRLALLTGGARDRPARQQTLRSTMDWSHDLLEPAEQILFARLAVFVGGCSLKAVEAVVNAAGDLPVDVLDGLAGLVDKSLLRRGEGAEDDPRFEMLETIREYAAERFAMSTDAAAVRERHAEYFLALAEQAAPELTGPQQRLWLERLEWDHDNLRAALGWALEQDRSAEGLRLAAALRRFWQVRGHLTEGQGWLERTLTRWPEAPASVRHAALDAAGNLAFARGEYDRSTALHTAALDLRRALGDQRGVALSLHNLGSAAHYAGDIERAVALFEQSLAIERELGDQRTVALTLNGLGVIARNLGDLGQARTLYEESLSILRGLEDNWGIGLLLNNLARVARDQEHWEEAIGLCHESLGLFQGLGDRQGVAWVLSNLVVVAERRNAWEWAAHLHGAVEALREAVGSTELSLSPSERDAYSAAVTATRARLGDVAFAGATAAGRTMSPEHVASGRLACKRRPSTLRRHRAPRRSRRPGHRRAR